MYNPQSVGSIIVFANLFLFLGHVSNLLSYDALPLLSALHSECTRCPCLYIRVFTLQEYVGMMTSSRESNVGGSNNTTFSPAGDAECGDEDIHEHHKVEQVCGHMLPE